MASVGSATAGQRLNEIFTLDPIAQEKNDRFWHTVWNVALFASAALLIIGAGAIFVGVSVYVPSQVLATVLALSTFYLMYGGRALNYLYGKVKHYQAEAHDHGEVAHLVNRINDSKLPAILKAYGLKCPTGVTATQVKRAVAQLLITEEKKKVRQNTWAELNQMPVLSRNWKRGMKAEDFRDIRDMISEKKNCKYNAAQDSVYAAYLLKLIQSPYEKREIDDFLLCNPGDPTTKVKVKTATRTYTAKELIEKDARTLSTEIFELHA